MTHLKVQLTKHQERLVFIGAMWTCRISLRWLCFMLHTCLITKEWKSFGDECVQNLYHHGNKCKIRTEWRTDLQLSHVAWKLTLVISLQYFSGMVTTIDGGSVIHDHMFTSSHLQACSAKEESLYSGITGKHLNSFKNMKSVSSY